MLVVVNGPYCFGCKGSRVVDRYFWGTVSWGTSGQTEGSVKRAVCLDCQGNIGSPYPLVKKPAEVGQIGATP